MLQPSSPSFNILTQLREAIAATGPGIPAANIGPLLSRAAERIQVLEAALTVITDELADALTTHIYDTEDEAGQSTQAQLIRRARDLLDGAEPWDRFRRLGVLGNIQCECPSILLLSVGKTHQDVLSFDHISINHELGIPTSVGDFTHTPSGRRYIVAVAPIPEEA